MRSIKTDCRNCIIMGRVGPITVCAVCKYCIEHDGCHCITCSICKKRVGPTIVCKKCAKCREHHTEQIPDSRDFPFRKCEYIGVKKPACVCSRAPEYTACKKCKKCPRHACDCKSFIISSLPRTIGCELEIADFMGFDEGYHNEIPVSISFEHDGSVQPSGRELVTGRMVGDKVPLAMGAIASSLAKHKAYVNETCGFHVHVDAADLSAADLRRVLVGFRLFQDEIFQYLVAPERADNIYCPKVALSDVQIFDLMHLDSSAAINNWFYQYLYRLTPISGNTFVSGHQRREAMRRFDAQVKGHKARKYENAARRQAINFHSWMMRGTVEFRLKEGTTSCSELVNWPQWCGWFVHKFASFADKEILWWMKKPPTLMELSERFCSTNLGGARMPKSVLEWVAACVASPPKVKPKKSPVPDEQSIQGTTATINRLQPQFRFGRGQLAVNLQQGYADIQDEPTSWTAPPPPVQYDGPPRSFNHGTI